MSDLLLKVYDRTLDSSFFNGNTKLPNADIPLDNNIQHLRFEFIATYTNDASVSVLGKGLFGLLDQLIVQNKDDKQIFQILSGVACEMFSRFYTGVSHVEQLEHTAVTEFTKRWIFTIPVYLLKSDLSKAFLDIKLGDFDNGIFTSTNPPTAFSVRLKIEALYVDKLPFTQEIYDVTQL